MLLIIDYDETITSHDTLSLIAPPSPPDGTPPFQHYLDAYLSDLEEHSRRRSGGLKGQEGRGEGADHAHDAGEEDHRLQQQMEDLDSLDELEIASLDRIERGGLFRGWRLGAAEERARERVEVRAGWVEAVRWVVDAGRDPEIELHSAILSVGWSAKFIKATVDASLSAFEGDGAETGGTGFPGAIYANEVELDSTTGVGSGKLTKSLALRPFAHPTGGIRTGTHKLSVLRRLKSSTARAGGAYTVYVGDSNTDLLCLLEADLGILMGPGEGVQKTLRKLGISHSLHEADQADELLNALETPKPPGEGGDGIGLTLPQKPYSIVRCDDWHAALRILQSLASREGAGGKGKSDR